MQIAVSHDLVATLAAPPPAFTFSSSISARAGLIRPGQAG
jgi:hypothetical protein